MKKSIIRLTVAVLVVSMLGCQASQEENIRTALVSLQDAYVEQDLDAIMAVYSEDYRGEEGGGKEQVRQFLKGAIDQGYLRGTTVNIEDAEIEIEGETATVVPVTYTGDWGGMDIKNVLKKEGATWRIIYGEEYY
ncbi:MAG: YybH family protein [Planctomycetota bacterium]